MNGPQHYREAERLLAIPGLGAGDDPRDPTIVACAQVHATLALAAAQAGSTLGLHGVPSAEWAEATR